MKPPKKYGNGGGVKSKPTGYEKDAQWNPDLVQYAMSTSNRPTGYDPNTGRGVMSGGILQAGIDPVTGATANWQNNPNIKKISGTGTPYQNIYEHVGGEGTRQRYIESFDPKTNKSNLYYLPMPGNYTPTKVPTIAKPSPIPTMVQNANQTDKEALDQYKLNNPQINYANGGYTHGKGLMKHVKGYANGGSTNPDIISSIAAPVSNFGSGMIDLKTQDPYGRYNTGSKFGDYAAGYTSGALSGGAKGIAAGAAFGPMGMVIGGGLGAGIGITEGLIKANQDEKSIASEKNNAEMAKLFEQQRLRNQMLQGSLSRERQNQTNMKDGGMVKGAGTAKSDSIPAKVKPGSFVVPAENAGAAKEIKKTMFPKAPTNKKANLNQDGGEGIKLSNGEFLFSAEEVKELKAAGIDLDKLAPLAEHAIGHHKEFANGGLTPQKAHEILRDGTIRGKKITDAQRKYFGYIYSQGKK